MKIRTESGPRGQGRLIKSQGEGVLVGEMGEWVKWRDGKLDGTETPAAGGLIPSGGCQLNEPDTLSASIA